MEYYSTKRFGPISTGHRQWRDEGHCKFAHGYGRYVKLTFACKSLDDKMWCMDFGGLRFVKQWLEEQWDHRMLIASNDPLLSEWLIMDKLGGIHINIMDVDKGWGPGIEGSCKFVFDTLNPLIKEKTNDRVWIREVEIYEHENNSAAYVNNEEQ
jgi:6-pyruvoyltetrahydropterin/6-carboxytetrahydropterin synthase